MFGIMRLQKLKSTYSMRASMRHSYREQETLNADPAKKHLNQFSGARSVDQAFATYKDRLKSLKGKVRANAVLVVEHLITASPEFFQTTSKQQQLEFFNKSLNWLSDVYGAENIVSAGIHMDEKTPHLWAYIVPIHEGKLNARHFIGGHKNRLSEMQTEFHQKCCSQFGLKRGIEKSGAKHTEVRHWYAIMREVLNLPKTTTAKRIKLILGDGLDDLVKGAAANAAAARQAVERSERAVRRLKEAQNAAESIEERFKVAQKLIKQLEAENAKQIHYRNEVDTLRAIIERNRDVIARNEGLLAPIETPHVKIDTDKSNSLKL